MGKAGRPKKDVESPPQIKKDSLDIGYDTPSNDWIGELTQVFGHPVQVIGPQSVPPSTNEGAVFYVLRPHPPVFDRYANDHFVYVSVRRKARELEGFRVEVRVSEHGQEYVWVNDQIKYLRLDPARSGVQFFDSFGEQYAPVLTVTHAGTVVPSLISRPARSGLR